jgi:OOP family OmpA-OmpF porin
MRLSTTILGVIAFLLAGVVAALAARVAVGAVEERSVSAVQEQIVMEGHAWARVIGDGLQVIIEGEAPSEAARFRAMSSAGGVVDASRVIDNIHVAETAGIATPDFAIEILRNDSGVSLIGLIPASTDRAALSAGIARIAGGAPVTDLLQAADYPVPPSWRPSLTFALEALERLPRSKISVEAGHVAITAISDSPSEQRRIEADLARRIPEGVKVTLAVSAPRPVISPFTIRFTIDERGPRFDACSADTEEDRDTILAAARAAGAEGKLDCRLGLGVPTRSWGEAVSRAIAALAEIGGGTVTFSDADVTLVAVEGTDSAVFDRVVGELSNALPDVFSLEALRPVETDAIEEGPPEFVVTLSPEGYAQVRGRVHHSLMNETVSSFARAQFGAENVTMGTRVAPEGLPVGWSVRVLAGIEAMSMMSNGAVTVLPDRVTVTGQTGDAAARDEIAQLFIDKLGQGARFSIDVVYVESLDPMAGMPTPEECVNAIRGVTEGRKITFEPGSATLNADAMPIIDDIAEVLRLCGDLRLRISGFTDSQGREETNLRLSQQRAESVLDALKMRRVPVGSFEAVGYGESNPIADNGTEVGRETNRRIEFSLIGAEVADVAGAVSAAADAPFWRPEKRPRARPGDRPDLSLAAAEAEGEEALAADEAEAMSGAMPEAEAQTGVGSEPEVATEPEEVAEAEPEEAMPAGEASAGPAAGAAAAAAPLAPSQAIAAATSDESGDAKPADPTGEDSAAVAGAGAMAAPQPALVHAPESADQGPKVLTDPPLLVAAAEAAAAELPATAEESPARDVAAPGQAAPEEAEETDPDAAPELAPRSEPEPAGDDVGFVNAMENPPDKRPRARAVSDDQ